jgi:hypothetical protein
MKKVILSSAFLLILLVLVDHSHGSRKAETGTKIKINPVLTTGKTDAGVKFFSASHAGN